MRISTTLFALMLTLGSPVALAEDDEKTPPPPRPGLGEIHDGTSNTIMMADEEEVLQPRRDLEVIQDGTSRWMTTQGTEGFSDGSTHGMSIDENQDDQHRTPSDPNECVLGMNRITTRCAEPTGDEVAPSEAGLTLSNFSAPTDLVITSAGGNRLRFSWQDHSNVEDSFIIERQLPMTSAWATIATARGPAATMGARSMATVIDGSRMTFCYRIRATRGSTTSEPSNRACAGLN